ncbi:unnamed protein product [Prunus brigantina]
MHHPAPSFLINLSINTHPNLSLSLISQHPSYLLSLVSTSCYSYSYFLYNIINMALSSRLTLMMASLVFSFLVLQYLTEAAHQSRTMNNNGAPRPLPPPTLDCGVACEGRCKLSSRPRLCKRACGSCCDKCGCVPPGTAGNYEACPCYASLTTRNQTRKCP